ncbi:MAG: IS1380 family transposase [Terriglobales bacterium]
MRVQDEAVLAERRERIEARLDPSWQEEMVEPMLAGTNVRYEMAARVQAIPCGGIGLMHELVRTLKLAASIDEHVHVFKKYFPYHESDHVLNLAYNVLAGGTRLEDIELLRTNEGYLDTLGCRRIPDPTTAGDFLRRFEAADVLDLMTGINDTRVRVWKKLPRPQRKLALIDVDGTLAPTTGACKEGMDISYKGTWGYAPLIVSLANTQEVLFTANRPGNAPSHSGAADYLDAAIALVREGGFKQVRLRGDTDFSLTHHFDRWDADGVEFVFGIDANPAFVKRAKALPEAVWKRLQRPVARPSGARRRPVNVKEQIVAERGYTNLVLEEEHITELDYTPTHSSQTYRMIVLRKTIRGEQYQEYLFTDVRYFFYVTNVGKNTLSPARVVFEANARCHQENLIEQLKNGVQALRMPADGLVANWAYLVIASLAWNLKAWLAIAVGRRRGQELRRMEYRRFLHSVMLLPCQVVQTARYLVLRLLTYSMWSQVLLDGVPRFRQWRLA